MLLDVGLGILFSLLISHIFGIGINPGLILFGIACCLLPDIDTIFHIKSGRQIHDHKGHEHRDLWHYPLLYIPIGTFVINFFSYPYALLFTLSSFSHFLHDSIGIGWGVQWLFPFSRRHFSFIYHYDVYRNNLNKHWIYNWKHNEVTELSEKYGDRDWVKNIYLKWHPYAIAEFLVFVIAVIVLAWVLLK